MTCFGLLYDLCLHVYACASLPKIITQPGRYRKSLASRLGVGFPHIEKKGRRLVWIHAVSLGETKAVQPLIKRLRALSDPPLILLSTTTQTGYEEGAKNGGADFHVYLPFDFSYVIRPIVKRVAPDVVILVETDFWYHFQQACKQTGAQVVLINGKISERSSSRLSKLPFLSTRLFNSIDHFYLQGDHYQKRFSQLNIPASKLTITGNIKLDTEIDLEEPTSLKKQLKLDNQPVLTLGSTHDPEEKIWISALKHLWAHFPQLKVFIVPRHPERFDAVAKLIASEKIPFARWSQKGSFEHGSIVLVDTMGVLRQCYQISDIAFVGGSLTPKVGGHNILEPAFYRKPVLFGPHMHSQPDLLELANAFQSGLQITEQSLIPTMQKLLCDTKTRLALGSNGHKLIASSRGALDLTWNALLPLLQKTNL